MMSRNRQILCEIPQDMMQESESNPQILCNLHPNTVLARSRVCESLHVRCLISPHF
jgi:hypothetical protein